MRRKRRLTQRDLRTLGATPGRMLTRYSPDGQRAEIRQVTAEARSRFSLGSRLTGTGELNKVSEGERSLWTP